MENYKIEKFLGNGSYGEVYLVFDLRENKAYAMKKLKNQPSTYLEIETMRQMTKFCKDTNLACFHDTFEYNNTIILVMDYVPGIELWQYVSDRIYTVTSSEIVNSFAWTLTKQMVYTLAVMNKHGFVHRDIKPENIIVNTSTRTFTLIDYGFSCTTCKGISGTKHYLPKYIYENMNTFMENEDLYEVYKKVDLYALGCTIFFTLQNGKTPYYTNSRKINMDFDHRTPWRTDIVIDPDLKKIVEKMLEMKYTAEDILDDIDNIENMDDTPKSKECTLL